MMSDGPLTKILVVDDDPVKRYSMARILRNAGFEVTDTGSGQECLRLAPAGFDLVVLDVNLPDVSGFDVCGRLKSDPTMVTPMVLHVSGISVQEVDRAHGLEAGADGYLTEPVDTRVFLATVNSLLRLRQLEAQARDFAAREREANVELVRRQEELTRLYEEARQSDRQKDQFLAMLGHELRNPLGAVSNALHVLREAEPSQETSRRAVDAASRQVSQLTRIVDDLLDVARVSHGKFELRRRPVQVQTLVELALEACRTAVSRHGHQLTVSLPDEPVWLDADPDRLLQALGNLLANAIKYTPHGGRISVRVVLTASPAPEVELHVQDTGVGIPPELLPSVFDLFIQAPGGLDRTEGGLGIGLSLVWTVVQLHGGSVSAVSAGSGQGSEFIIRLPTIAPPEAGTQRAPNEATPEPARSGRVLLVEDNRDSAETLVEILESWGHTVAHADDGVKGLELAQRWAPDVILIDIGLPAIDGYEVARRLRARYREALGGDEARPRLIALTGYGQEADRRRSEDAGFDHHLVKPVDLTVLKDLLRALARQAAE
jgi:signal transduction histidine kinase